MLSIRRLAFTGSASGADATAAVVEFGERATIIFGASNTGKSVLVSAFDFMLGGKELKRVREDRPFTRVELTIVSAPGREQALSRALDGGDLWLADREAASPSAGRVLKAKSSLGAYFLEQVNLAGKKLLKNQSGETRAFTIRTLAHLCVIGETQIQSEAPPPLPGQAVERTPEAAALKLLLEGRDDADVVGPTESANKRRVSRGKAEALANVIASMRSSLTTSDEPEQLRESLTALNEELSQLSARLDQGMERRTGLLERYRELVFDRQKRRDRLGELSETIARFELLRTQYRSDLDRLEMVDEAGGLLGMFRPGICVFCGAEESAQHLNLHLTGEVTALSEAISAEMSRTRELLADLNSVMAEAAVEETTLAASLRGFDASIEERRQELLRLEDAMTPVRSEIASAVERRIAAERALTIHEQIAQVEESRALFAGQAAEPAGALEVHFDAEAVKAFSLKMRSIATYWGLPGADDISFDVATRDVVISGESRASQGKGMRALLHALFTLALAEHCITRQLPHLGVVVLDSPLVTYKEAARTPGLDEGIPASVGDQFYRYIAREFPGQVIVVENQTPPADIYSEASIYQFTGTKAGRTGLYPPLPAGAIENV
jgi:hypothetical protein